MGTFEKIRQTSPYALGIFAVVFIGFMVLSDADFGSMMSGGKNYQTAPIAIINGESILYRDFNSKVQERIEQQQAQSQESDIQVDEKQIRKDIWHETIEMVLMEQEAQKAGIFITNEQILDVMIESPPEDLKRNFADSTGKFNRTWYLEIITNPERLKFYLGSQFTPEQVEEQIINFKKVIISVENYIKDSKLRESLAMLVNTSETILSPDFVKERFLAEKSQTSVDFIFFDVNSANETEISVSPEEIKEYYNRQKRYFEQKPLRKIKYVRYAVQPSTEDTLRAVKRVGNIDDALHKAENKKDRDSIFDVKLSEYGGSTSEFVMIADLDKKKMQYLDTLKELDVIGPINLGQEGVFFFRMDEKRSGENEMVKASHILIRINNNSDSAKVEAKRILREAKNSNDFAGLAMKYSQDQGSARKGGDLGFFTKGKMVKVFEDAAFNAKPGQIVGPVESEFGFHIIKVIDKKSDEIKFSEINLKPTLSTSTKNKLFREAYSISRQTEAGASFDTLVAKLGLVATLSNYVTKNQPLLGSEYLTFKAFEQNVGTVIEPMELEPYGIIVAQVFEARQGGFQPLAEISEKLRTELVHTKKLDAIKDNAEKTFQRLSGITELKDATNIDSLLLVRTAKAVKRDGNIPGIGIDYGLSSNAFLLPTGKILGPIRGTRGYYIMQIYNRKMADTTNVAEIYTFKTDMKRKISQRAFYDWFGKVKENAVIEDFRNTFYTDY